MPGDVTAHSPVNDTDLCGRVRVAETHDLGCAARDFLATASHSSSFHNDVGSTSLKIIGFSNIITGDEPHITFSRLVIDKETGEILRHASAEFYLEEHSLSGQPRSIWNMEINVGGYEGMLGLGYSAAAVSGADTRGTTPSAPQMHSSSSGRTT